MLKKKLANLLIIIIGIFLIVNLTRSIWQLWQLGDKTKGAEQQLSKVKLQNEDLKKRLSEVQSPEYLEKMARDKLGLAKEGEMVVILPPFQETPKPQAEDQNLPNWQKWWKLFF